MTGILKKVRPALFVEFRDEVGRSGHVHLLAAGYDLLDATGNRWLGASDEALR